MKKLLITQIFGPLVEYVWYEGNEPLKIITVDYTYNQVWVWKNRRGHYKRIDVTPATLERIKNLVIRSAQ